MMAEMSHAYQPSTCRCGRAVYQTPDGVFDILPDKQLVPAGVSGLGGPYSAFQILTVDGWLRVGVVPVYRQHVCRGDSR